MGITKIDIHKLYIFTMISLILQLFILFYINIFYLKSADIDSVEFVDVDSIGEEKKNDIESFGIPSDIENVQVSNDFMYTSYIDENKLMTLKLDSKSSPQTVYELEEGEEINKYYWLKDRLFLFFGVKKTFSNYASIRIFTYDVKNERLLEFKDKGRMFASLPRAVYIDQMDVSAYTNSAYIKLITSETESRIYAARTMNEIETTFRINTTAESKMAEYTFCDNLVYEKDDNIRIWSTVGNLDEVLIDKSQNYRIIGIDINDTLYVCQVDDDNNIEEISYGEIDDISKLESGKNNQFKFNRYTLEKKINYDDLQLNHYGVLYLNNKDNKKLVFILYNNEKGEKTNAKKEVKYKGELIELMEKNIIYKDDGKIIIDEINKEEKE